MVIIYSILFANISRGLSIPIQVNAKPSVGLSLILSDLQILFHGFCMLWGFGIPLKSILDAVHFILVRFILAEYWLVSMHEGPAHTYFMGIRFSKKVRSDSGKYFMLLATAHLLI